MLATFAALHLLVLAQPSPPPGEPAHAAAAAEPSRAPQPPAAPEGPRQVSLLSGESLHGGNAVLAWAGWSSLGAMYAMGFTDRDDVGVFLEYDWAKSENRLGLLYRRPLGKAGSFDVGGRLSAAWYLNFGSDYIHESNQSDRGLEIVPGIAFSRRGGAGIFSALAEAPMTVTTKYGSGFLFSPRASLAFEAPLYPSVTVGARVGAGYRAGAGDAPLREGRGELQFLVLAGYQLL
jgi:hypothetical protein